MRSLQKRIRAILKSNVIKLHYAYGGTQTAAKALLFEAAIKVIAVRNIRTVGSAENYKNRYRERFLSNAWNLSTFRETVEANTIGVSCTEDVKKKDICSKSALGILNVCYAEKHRKVTSTIS